jgi:hypothetical protein
MWGTHAKAGKGQGDTNKGRKGAAAGALWGDVRALHDLADTGELLEATGIHTLFWRYGRRGKPSGQVPAGAHSQI